MENFIFLIEFVSKTMFDVKHDHIVRHDRESGQRICQWLIGSGLVIFQAVYFLITLIAILVWQVLPVIVIVQRVLCINAVGNQV